MDQDLQDHFKELDQELRSFKQEVRDMLNKRATHTSGEYINTRKAAAAAVASEGQEQDEGQQQLIGKLITDLNESIINMKHQVKTNNDIIKKLEVEKQLKLQERKNYINYYYYLIHWQEKTRPVAGENDKKPAEEKKQDLLSSSDARSGMNSKKSSSSDGLAEGSEWLSWAIKNE